MNRKEVAYMPRGSQFPTLFGFFELLTAFINTDSHKTIGNLLAYRKLLGSLLAFSTLFLKFEAASNIRLKLRRLIEGQAVFRETDDTYHWIMHFIVNHSGFQNSSKDVEVTAYPLIGGLRSAMILQQDDLKQGMDRAGPMYRQPGLAANQQMKKMDDVKHWTGCAAQKHRPVGLTASHQLSKLYDTDESDDDEPEVGKDGVKEKRKRRKVVYTPAQRVATFFRFQGTSFWVRPYQGTDTTGRQQGKLTLTYWSRTSTPLERLLDHAQDVYNAALKDAFKTVSIYRMDRDGYWKPPKVTAIRRSDTLHLPGTVKEEIFADAKGFFSNRCVRKYAERCIPYRRGYLFYGPPGNGKSTIATVLASELDEPIYLIDIGSPSINDDSFLQAMKSLPARCIVLMEDIDVAFVKRGAKQPSSSASSSSSSTSSSSSPSSTPEAGKEVAEVEEKKKESVVEETKKRPKTKRTGISFSAVLNALDGVDAQEGRLLCVTTNHIEKLDPALIRPGRIDRKFEIKNATSEQAKELFIRWFTPRNKPATEEVEMRADTFAQAIQNDKLSVAALQGYLIGCDEDPSKAAQNVEAWLKEQKEE